MPWGRLDDSLYDHPKLDDLPGEHRLAAIGLWARAISWCNRFLTDGHVPRERITKLDGTRELADMLVVAGLFENNGSGYIVHDFLEFNDSREQVETRRKTERDRKAEWRKNKRPGVSPSGTPNGDDENVPPSVPPESRRPSQRVSRDSRGRSARESRPGPARPVLDESTPPTPSPARGRTRRRDKSNGTDPDQYDSATITDENMADRRPDWARAG